MRLIIDRGIPYAVELFARTMVAGRRSAADVITAPVKHDVNVTSMAGRGILERVKLRQKQPITFLE